MNRAAIIAVAALALGAFIYWQGGKDTRQQNETNRLEREGDISDAINDSDNAPDWRERLRCRYIRCGVLRPEVHNGD